MTKPLEALTPEMARESANILIIVAARLVRRECLTPLHALSELNQKTISTRALRDAIDRVEESLLREAGKICNGHERLLGRLKDAEAALEQSQQDHRLHVARLLSERGQLKDRIAELESRPVAPIDFKENADADFCREWAWDGIKKDLPTENWSISDGAAFYGFYLMGWDARRQFNEQRKAEALKLFRAAGTVGGE